MTPILPRLRSPFVALSLAAGLASTGAYAQGTDAQREACAPDAVSLCQDTIPDVAKTTACMKAHFSQLSPRCQREFSEATEPSRKAGRPRTGMARREVAPAPSGTAGTVEVPPVAPLPERASGLDGYEGQIRAACRQGLIDPFTCRNTLDVLHSVE